MYLMQPYDDALTHILENGIPKSDRTGVGCISVAGMQCRYRLDERFPLVSRRKVWPKAVFAELLWFLSGSTNTNDLNKLGAKFWDPWKSEEFEQKHGFVDGSLGPVYGFQLRHFGGIYGNGAGGNNNLFRDSMTDPGGEDYVIDYSRPSPRKRNLYGTGGFDQLKYMVDELKTNPMSRRIMFNLWNPRDMAQMRIPACHFTYQAIVDGNGGVTGILTQRSADYPVGVPANIQFYSALTMMLAKEAGLKPYEFVHSTNDSHIYLDQVDAVKKYLETPIVDSPTLKLGMATDIYSYQVSDFQLENYNPGPKISIPVAV